MDKHLLHLKAGMGKMSMADAHLSGSCFHTRKHLPSLTHQTDFRAP